MNEKPRDDVTLINGIGKVWRGRLYKSGLRTFWDLAAPSSEEKLTQLKPAPSKSQREAWINEAQKLAEAARSSTKTELESTEFDRQTSSLVESGEWEWLAAFLVEFRVRKVEGEVEEQQIKVEQRRMDKGGTWLEDDKKVNSNVIAGEQLYPWMLEQIGETALPGPKQQIEEIRAKVQHDLEQELGEQRAAAQQELEKILEGERTRTQKMLHEELKEERTQARHALEKELDEKRSQAQLELVQSLEKERNNARQALQKELDEERTQVQKVLEQERTRARQALEEELDEKRSQAQLELEQALGEERKLIRKDLEQKSVEEAPEPLMEPVEKETQLPPKPPKEEFRLTAQPTETPHLVPTIVQFQVFQPTDVAEVVGKGIPGQPFSGLISSDELVTFAVDFELAEPAGPEIIQQNMTYYVQFYARDLSTGSKEHLGNTKAKTFVEGKSSYDAKLADITLEGGIYEIAVLVTVQNKHPSTNFLRVPLLQVV